MSENNLMTPSMLAKELNAGSATVRFWLNRFSRYLPYTWAHGEKLYNSDTLKTLLFISQKIDSGMAASDVEKALEDLSDSSSNNQPLPRINESLELLSALFDKFYSQQERIAAAQERKAIAEEKRAEAEEKKAQAEKLKAQALEKRAEAELQKANAMNNLADAVKNISSDFLSSLADNAIFSGLNQKPSTKEQDPAEQLDELTTEADQTDILDAFTDDELNDDELNDQDIDDLYSLIEDKEHESQNRQEDIDDPYSLIEDEKTQDYEDDDIDDLYSLIDNKPNEQDIDDLSALIEDDQPHELKPEILDSDVDDLMALIDDDINQDSGEDNLLDIDIYKNDDFMDDLSSLIDDEPEKLNPNILDADSHNITNDIHDDLSALIDEDENIATPPKIERPKASLEENFERYKSEVINIIIKLRKDGHTVDQTTEVLNNEQIKPLSGKERWTEKMIAKIYKFIEVAEK